MYTQKKTATSTVINHPINLCHYVQQVSSAVTALNVSAGLGYSTEASLPAEAAGRQASRQTGVSKGRLRAKGSIRVTQKHQASHLS